MIEKLLELGFKKTYQVEGRSSIAALMGKRRCGIYILHFANGDYYVGQSIDVVLRYTQHKKRHLDIQLLTFKVVRQKDLDVEEVRVTKALENYGVFLRNIKIVTFTHAVKTDFDAIMSPNQQKTWLDKLDQIDFEGERIRNNDLRRRYSANFSKYLKLPYANEVIPILRNYVLNTIPAVKRAEVDFWMCSCLPSNSSSLYTRINVGWQSTLEVYLFEGLPHFCWYVPISVLPKSLVNRWKISNLARILFNSPNITLGSSALKAGGLDQIWLDARGINAAQQILQNPKMISVFRKFNLGLVRKSPCPWGRNHCLDLADHLVE